MSRLLRIRSETNGQVKEHFLDQCSKVSEVKQAGDCRFSFQLTDSPTAMPPSSPGQSLASRRLVSTYCEDNDSSGSEESSLSCIQSLDGWELVSKDVLKKLKGQEFLRRLQVSMSGEVTREEK